MTPWNKGLTKLTNPSLLKTSITLADKIGDGCMERLARTDKITISFNRKEQEHLQHISKIITLLFKKTPNIRIRKTSQCDDLYLYQKELANRLKFPYGKKLNHKLEIPEWIKKDPSYLRHCLKGLFETDGNWFIDKKYKTNVIKFTNHSNSLLDDLYETLMNMDYHPQRQRYDVRLARQKEVYKFVEWIQFRKY